MKSHRVESYDVPTADAFADDEILYRLVIAVAEQALLDYRRLVRNLADGKYRQRTKALEDIDDYFSLREYFDSGCNGMVDAGDTSIAQQIDKRLMREDELDTNKAKRNANKILNEMDKDFVLSWHEKGIRKYMKEMGYDDY